MIFPVLASGNGNVARSSRVTMHVASGGSDVSRRDLTYALAASIWCQKHLKIYVKQILVHERGRGRSTLAHSVHECQNWTWVCRTYLENDTVDKRRFAMPSRCQSATPKLLVLATVCIILRLGLRACLMEGNKKHRVFSMWFIQAVFLPSNSMQV